MAEITKRQARARIKKMENEYGYSNTWPERYQREYEELLAILYAVPTHADGGRDAG